MRAAGRPALVAALLLMFTGSVLVDRVAQGRQSFAPGTPPSRSGEVATLRQLVGQISYEARRILANVLYMKLDGYVHEGPPVDLGNGRYGRTMNNNLDVVPLYRLITILDPHFIEAYSLAASHLNNGMNRIDDSIAILHEGINENAGQPGAAALYAQLGATYMRDRQDYAAARRAFEPALDVFRRFGAEADSLDGIYTARSVNSMLINACWRQHDEAAALRAMGEPHELNAEHPAVIALSGRVPAPVVVPSAAPQARPHEHEHKHTDGDGCPDDTPGNRVAAESGTRALSDPHHRRWMEEPGLGEIRRQLALVGGAVLALALGFAFRRWRFRLTALLFVLAPLAAHAEPAFDPIQPPPIISNNMVEIFLLFVVIVAIILVLVLNHLVRKGRRLEATGHDKFFGYVEEALKLNPTDEKHLEVGVLSVESGLNERALSYLTKVSDKNPALKLRAQYFELLALLGTGRLEAAASLQDRLALDHLASAEKYRIARAWKEHNLLSRARSVFLRVFLTDIAFADVGQQLEEINSREKQAAADGLGFLSGIISPRYRDLKLASESEREVVCLAFDADLSRTVRLRVLRPERADDATVQAFLEEVALLSRAQHPAVLSVYDLQKEKMPYVSLEDFEGKSLAEHAKSLGVGARLELALRVLSVVKDLVGEGKLLPCLPRSAVLVGADGAVRVCRAPDLKETPLASLSAAFADVLPTTAPGLEFVEAGLARVLALAQPRNAPPADLARVLRDIGQELSSMEQFVKLGESERERQGLLAHLRWLDEIHRSKVHGLKSKFAVCERYRDEPGKLVRAFFRTANLEEVARMLAGLEEMVTGANRLPPCRHIAMPNMMRMVGEAARAGRRADLTALAQAGEATDAAGRAQLESLAAELPRAYERFKDLSVAISRLVEEFELDLVRLVEGVMQASTYASQLKLDAVVGEGRVRVADTAGFRREFALALENLISNSFEAHASVVEIEIRRVESELYRILLRDDGTGVPDDLMERIRHSRYTSKVGGTSTGVMSAKELVEKHRGRFEIRSRTEAKGTEVALMIPAA